MPTGRMIDPTKGHTHANKAEAGQDFNQLPSNDTIEMRKAKDRARLTANQELRDIGADELGTESVAGPAPGTDR